MTEEPADEMQPATTPLAKTGVMFLSVHWSRLLAAAIFIVTGLLDLHYLGYYIGDIFGTYTGTGMALIPGGPSFFWLIGMPILVIGGILVLYFLLSIIKYEFTFDAGSGSFVATGKWFSYKWTYEVSPVTRIVYQRHRIGPKAWWIVALIFFITTIIQYGGGLFNLPRSTSNTLPVMMLMTAISDGTALVVLIFLMQSSLRVYTRDRVYDFWVSCPPRNDVVYKYFVDQVFPVSKITQPQRTTNLDRTVIGIVLFIGSLLGLYANILLGEWFSMIGLMYGLILVLEGLFLDIHQETSIREPGADTGRFQMEHHHNALNYWIDITDGAVASNDHDSIVPAWHGLFMAYLLGNIAIQITYALRFGAIVDPFSLTNFIASIAFGIVVGLGFSKLLRKPKVILVFFVASLVASVILGVVL
ncbi:MAG TPA: hypothetical protein VKM55_19375 [Candidatus Lokiarchaeia archaeon]|nr:hypothetical protein [Candidatus Lokiarchaeia archaeon]